MPCYSPVTLYKSREGPNRETGRWPLVTLANGYIDRPQKVPCGRCIGCRLERSRQWAVRCVYEASGYDDNCFLTLTYRQDNLVYGGNAYGTLVPRDLELFWKRLRKEFGSGIRYFACGEYGERKRRPHYHAAVFGFNFSDRQFLRCEKGNDYYRSEDLNRLWRLGDCVIGALTFESAAYVARYIVGKKLGGDAKIYADEGIQPEFVRMSRRPGIGSDWYDKYKDDLYPSGYVLCRGVKSSIPRYFNDKFIVANPEMYEEVLERRKDAMAARWRDSTPDRLRVRERVKLAQVKSLARTLESHDFA